MKRTNQDDADVATNVPHHGSRERTTGPEPMPRWVVVFGVIAAALLLGFVIVHLTGRGLGHHGTSSQTPQPAERNPGAHQ
jgi:hypothetical protein